MIKKKIIIHGNNFSDIEGFYSEVDHVLTRNLDWKTGHNLDAFNDLLRGGFGVHEYEEPIKLIWKNSNKSKRDLSNLRDGQTTYQILIEIINGHNHIEFEEA
jgi:RNAse (barnase) inhibitor barstar